MPRTVFDFKFEQKTPHTVFPPASDYVETIPDDSYNKINDKGPNTDALNVEYLSE